MIVRGCMQNQKIMSIEQTDFDHMLPLTPVSSFRPPDTVAINRAASTGQPVVTNLVMTNP